MDRGASGIRRVSTLTLGLVLISCCCLYDTLSATSFTGSKRLKLCIVEPNRRIINDALKKLQFDVESEVECIAVNDRLTCLRRVASGDAHFAVLEPEDLVVASSYTKHNITITHELRRFKHDIQRFAMTAIISMDIKNSADLVGKKYCHGGFKNSDDSTRVFSTYFQNWILSRKCDRDKTLVEYEISKLSSFFGSACIPGAWTPDSSYDSYLKSKYKNLCALCNNPVECSHSDKYEGREGALRCLTEKAADVAWVRLDDALHYFKTQGINESRYSCLRPDGTTTTLTGEKWPCVWIAKPWPVVVANREAAKRVTDMVGSLVEKKFTWQHYVKRLMGAYNSTLIDIKSSDNDTITNIKETTPKKFLNIFPGFAPSNYRTHCQSSRLIKWCVGSKIEYLKCQWMRNASLAYGIEPSITCIHKANRIGCLNALQNERADVFVVKPEEKLKARLRGSIPIVRVIGKKKKYMNRVVALVRNDSRYRTFKDLRGARVCFTGNRSIDWNAFLNVMSDAMKNENWKFSKLRTVSKFFKDSCVFGLKDLELKNSIPSNLHSLCQQGFPHGKTMNATYDCLNSGRGDVAFVNLKKGFNKRRISGSNLRAICVDSSDSKKGNTCFLRWRKLGSVMVNEKMTELRRMEISSTLLEIDAIFGKRFPDQTPAFSLYGPYDSSRNIIFPARTQRLQRDADHVRLPRNYTKVKRLVDSQKKVQPQQRSGSSGGNVLQRNSDGCYVHCPRSCRSHIFQLVRKEFNKRVKIASIRYHGRTKIYGRQNKAEVCSVRGPRFDEFCAAGRSDHFSKWHCSIYIP